MRSANKHDELEILSKEINTTALEISRSDIYEHPGSVGKSETAGLKLPLSHARSKLRVMACGT